MQNSQLLSLEQSLKLKTAMKITGYHRRLLAERFGIKYSILGLYLNGKTPIPNYLIPKLESLLNIKL